MIKQTSFVRRYYEVFDELFRGMNLGLFQYLQVGVGGK